MSRPSSIDKLPQTIREEIGRLRVSGKTLDQILEHLRLMTPEMPSRSALGRHVMKMDALGQQMRRSREVAEALAGQLGDAPGSELAKMNIELLHGTVMKLFMEAADGESDDLSKLGLEALKGDPEGVMMLAKTIESLTRASKTNNDYIAQAEKRATERAQKAAVVAVEAVARTRGIGADTLDAIKRGIFGVAA